MYRDEVRELVLGTLWSQWTELGLSGWERRHHDVAIDLEALILATARLGQRDVRLQNEALDWCVAHGRFASAVRLKHLIAEGDDVTARAAGPFVATVNANSQLRWPGAGTALPFTPTGRSDAPLLVRPALIQLRLRALWGVSGRAEVLRVMLAEGARFMRVSEVAAGAGFGKDAVAEALDSLSRGGLLDQAGAGNHRLFRLRRREELVTLVGPEPDWTRSWPWQIVLPIMSGLLEAADASPKAPMAHAAEIQRRLRGWQPAFSRLGVIPPAAGTGAQLVRNFEEFSLRALRRWSGVETAATVG